VSGHTELAIYATSSLAKHAVLTELQGSCANLPDEWREDMEHANWGEVSGGEGEDDGDDEDGDEDAGESPEATEKRKAREKEKEIRRRRSGRTGRRDFSIIWSERRRHYQLFLGPARFLNVS
jgi:histone-lysine N-methyltransferase SUV420H